MTEKIQYIKRHTKGWRAIYVRSRAEKKAQEALTARGIECFLPIQRKLRQWSDRKKVVEMPAINGYLFVNPKTLQERQLIPTINHVVAYVRFQGKDAIIPDKQIQLVKKILHQTDIPATLEIGDLPKGKNIMVKEGPFAGEKATVVETKGKKRVVVQVEQVNFLLTLEIDSQIMEYQEL
jgi:transcription antitermination factor NusG